MQSKDQEILKFGLIKIRYYTLEDLAVEIENWTEEYLKFKVIIESMLKLLQTSDDKEILVN